MALIVGNAEVEVLLLARLVMALDNVLEVFFTKLFLERDILLCVKMVCVLDAKDPVMTMH